MNTWLKVVLNAFASSLLNKVFPMSKPEISPLIRDMIAYPVLVIGVSCYYTGLALTYTGSFLIDASGLCPQVTAAKR